MFTRLHSHVIAWTLIFICSAMPAQVSGAEPTIEDVAFKSTLDGTEQRYVLMLPVAFQHEQSHDLLIVLHGHGSDRWQFVKQQRGECKAARDFASKHNLIYVSPDYRASTSWMGPRAEADVVQLISDLRKREKIARVFICGGSMGGSSALAFTAMHPELIHGVAAMNGTANFLEYTQFQDAISASFGDQKSEIPDEYKKRSAEYWPERLTMPVAMSTGGKDALVPPQSCIRLESVLQQLKRPVFLLHREQGGHETNYEDSLAILEFMYSKATP
jgi:predicted esterase